MDLVLVLPVMVFIILFAILTIEARDLIYSILSFCLMCISIGAFYFILNAIYVGVFQLLIYAGAVVALAIAAVMLTVRREVKK